MNVSVDTLRGETPASATPALHPLNRLRYQIAAGLLLAVVVPGALYHIDDIGRAFRLPSSLNTGIGASFAFIASIYLYRRVASYPGIGLLGYVMPAVCAGYGTILAVFFAARLEYSRLNFGMSFAAAICFLFLLTLQLRKYAQQRFYIIPSRHALTLTQLPGAFWTVLKEAHLPDDKRAVLIADLRANLAEEWERLIAAAALSGYPVYHSKQVHESLTGRVEIEHLSENSFGSLIPNHSYHKVKRATDLLLSVALLPLLLPLMVLVAAFIRLDSPGPVFFRQERRGFRGETFQVLKFRTMRHGSGNQAGAPLQSSITQTSDPRITRVGRFLRRTRIDELPQVWNILKGEMSWIGPRPEALSLSDWYLRELPFYPYRHIVRPGLTGWAQVNQGHVADLDGVLAKLQYDFFYIKNFSAWLDVLIIWRTVGIVFSGFGAK